MFLTLTDILSCKRAEAPFTRGLDAQYPELGKEPSDGNVQPHPSLLAKNNFFFNLEMT